MLTPFTYRSSLRVGKPLLSHPAYSLVRDRREARSTPYLHFHPSLQAPGGGHEVGLCPSAHPRLGLPACLPSGVMSLSAQDREVRLTAAMTGAELLCKQVPRGRDGRDAISLVSQSGNESSCSPLPHLALHPGALISPDHPETNAGSGKHPTGTGQAPRGHSGMRNNSPNQPPRKRKRKKKKSGKRASYALCPVSLCQVERVSETCDMSAI